MTAPVQQGDVLAGKYRVDKVLGEGGMGVVVAATHLQLDQRVAIKFLLPEALSRPEMVERFGREARAVVKIQSEHVARVSDVGTLDSGSPYIVMEYLEGKDLGQLLEAQGPLAVEEAVRYVLQACEAVAEAHAAGIVHRDLKPANLFLAQRADKRAIVKVLDFGISKTMEPSGALTQTTSIMGTPYYISPEQLASSKKVDGRTDIWALGVILFELLAGHTPFQGDSMPALVAAILNTSPPPLHTIRPEVPPGLSAVIDRCLRKDPNDRYQDIAHFVRSLVDFSPSQGETSVGRVSRVLYQTSVPPPSLGSVTREAVAPAQNASPLQKGPEEMAAKTLDAWGTSELKPEASRRKGTFILVGAGTLLLGLLGGGLVLSKMRGTASGASEVPAPSARPVQSAHATPSPTPMLLAEPKTSAEPSPATKPARDAVPEKHPKPGTVAQASPPPAATPTSAPPPPAKTPEPKRTGLDMGLK